uniref:Crystallin, zeta (quinone reductase)-like 1 n=1 Tax=Eptatretus burgeri TaxID=7764 RepID=A0A8C4N7V7_EPTBU
MPGLFFHPGAPTEEPSFCLEEKSTQLQLRMGEVLVMVKACGLSAVDIQFLKVLYMLQNPHPVGREIAGIIKEVGPNVKFFKPNDEVVGILPLGCTQSGLSTLVAVHEHFIVPKPPAVSWDDAAGAVSEGLGAYTALHYLGHITPRDIIIVADGALMSGLMLVQLAMHRGARVLATVLSAEEADFLRSLQPAPGVSFMQIREGQGDWGGETMWFLSV